MVKVTRKQPPEVFKLFIKRTLLDQEAKPTGNTLEVNAEWDELNWESICIQIKCCVRTSNDETIYLDVKYIPVLQETLEWFMNAVEDARQEEQDG